VAGMIDPAPEDGCYLLHFLCAAVKSPRMSSACLEVSTFL
jgi:hypothetical protein